MDENKKTLNLNIKSMAFLDYVLQTPSYGWKDTSGNLVRPNAKQIFGEFFYAAERCERQA